VKAEAGQPIQYAMDADDYRSDRAALAEGPYRALLVWRLAIAYRLRGKLAITARLRYRLFVHERRPFRFLDGSSRLAPNC
jgi:hypothetical protein